MCTACAVSSELQGLADRQGPVFFQHRMAQGDVAYAEPTMPEKDRFLIVLATHSEAGHDLPQFGMQVALGYFPEIDMRAQRPERQSLAALPPIVDHHLAHDVGER